MDNIDSIGGLLKLLKRDRADEKQLNWFRGHSDHRWKLLPGYQRLQKPQPESVLLNRFKQNANLLLNQYQQPKSDFDWLFIMQHYGVPTRLLDWTESPLVALYFAVSSSPQVAGALWVLDPVRLNKSTKGKPEDYEFLPAFDDERVEGYRTQSVEASSDLGIEPMAVIATRNNARIQAQLGVFTISHFGKKELNKVADGAHLIVYKIPAASKKKILSELKLLAFDKFQVFPELASIGELLRGSMK